MTTLGLFDSLTLSEGSYADFTGFDINTPPSALINALISVENGLSLAQATEFARKWRVVSHLPNTSSGFSASLSSPIKKLKIKIDYGLAETSIGEPPNTTIIHPDRELARNYCHQMLRLLDKS